MKVLVSLRVRVQAGLHSYSHRLRMLQRLQEQAGTHGWALLLG